MSVAPRKRATKRVVYSVSSDEDGDSAVPEPLAADDEWHSDGSSSSSAPVPATQPTKKRKAASSSRSISITEALMSKKPARALATSRDDRHSTRRHSIQPILDQRQKLLDWFETAKGVRAMPWRADYDPSLSPEAQTQRAYEVLVSEIMLQQTQVTTVIPYYNKWLEAFPTVHALAAADIEAVNQRWKGLGYYSRGARLLAAAQKVVNELDSRFPANAASMEKLLPGVGRYTAGAVCSIVFNEQTPAVDGNVQRLFSRLLALHAPLKGNQAKQPLEMIWTAAKELVTGTATAGALNQALIELGSTVCKPTNPACGGCPLRGGCKAYGLSQGSVETLSDIEDICTTCEPFPDNTTGVTRFPMKVVKKPPREEACAVNVITWKDSTNSKTWALLVRRPETGLLAGLHEFPTKQVDGRNEGNKKTIKSSQQALLSTYLADPSCVLDAKTVDAGSVLHIYSHIRMTYHVVKTVIVSDERPALRQVDEAEVAKLLPGAAEAAGNADSDAEDEAPKKKRKTIKGAKAAASKTKSSVNKGPRVRWVPAEDVLEENISTGAVKIWKLSKGALKAAKSSA